MQLCRFSSSKVLSHLVLAECPLGLTATEAKKCPCRKREYHVTQYDLTVLTCTHPDDWRGRPLATDGPTLKANLKSGRRRRSREQREREQSQPEPERNLEMTAAANPVTTTADTAPLDGGAIATAPKMNLSLYDRMRDPLDAINKLGVMLYQSHMFGCGNENQGRVMAMTCLTERKSPFWLKTRYHLIEGNFSMRTDAMLAEFRRLGGDHDIESRTPDLASITLRINRKKATFSFSWAEAQQEPFPYEKGGKTLKKNWRTPRARMQMLWARVVSDGVRAMCPEAVVGSYTPEELGGEYTEDEIIEGEVVETATVSTPITEVETVATDADGEVIDASFQVVEDGETAPFDTEAQQAEERAKVTAAIAAEAPTPAEREGMVTEKQLLHMKKHIDALGMSGETWKQVVGRFGVTSAKELDHDQADRICGWLVRQLTAKRTKDEQDVWLNSQNSGQQGNA